METAGSTVMGNAEDTRGTRLATMSDPSTGLVSQAADTGASSWEALSPGRHSTACVRAALLGRQPEALKKGLAADAARAEGSRHGCGAAEPWRCGLVFHCSFEQ